MDDEYNDLYVDELDTGELDYDIEDEDCPDYDDMDSPLTE